MKFKKRGQISTEYLVIVSFLTFVAIGVLGVAFFYTGEIRDAIKFNQIEQFSNKIISSAESVFFAGEPSKITLTAYLPESVDSIIILDNPNSADEIIFHVSSSSGTNVISYRSNVPLAGGSISTSRGLKKISIVASPLNNVAITEVS